MTHNAENQSEIDSVTYNLGRRYNFKNVSLRIEILIFETEFTDKLYKISLIEKCNDACHDWQDNVYPVELNKQFSSHRFDKIVTEKYV